MDRHRELRAGLILHGGLSAGAYVGGVTHEFSACVNGQNAYGLVKILTDTDFTVDVISGASVAALNGLFLAYALTNNRDYGSTTEFWRSLADPAKLLSGRLLSLSRDRSSTVAICILLLACCFARCRTSRTLDTRPR